MKNRNLKQQTHNKKKIDKITKKFRNINILILNVTETKKKTEFKCT